MYVKYVAHSNATADTIKADIVALVNGSIATANDFGDSCQKSNTVILGTFPTGLYTVANATSMTIKKEHHDYANTFHYIRLQFSGNNWVSTVLAAGYTTETDTLLSGVQYPTSNTNTTANGMVTYHIVVGEKAFHIGSEGGVAKHSSVFDLGKTGVTRAYTNSMLAAHMLDFYTGNNTVVGSFGIPYTYNIITETYGAAANLYCDTRTPAKQGLSNGTLFAVENPVSIYGSPTANSYSYVYGLVKPGPIPFVPHATYSDSTTIYRYSYGGFSIIAD